MNANETTAITHGTRIFFRREEDGARIFGTAGEIQDDGTALIDCEDGETRILSIASLTIA